MMEVASNTNQESSVRSGQAPSTGSRESSGGDAVSFARSQDVDLYQVTFAKDSAWPFLVELGSSARCLQFVDLNRNEQSFNLPYTPQIKLCEETLSRLKYLIDECGKAHIDLNKPRDLQQFNQSLHKLTMSRQTSEGVIFDQIAKDVKEKAEFIKTQKQVTQEMLK